MFDFSFGKLAILFGLCLIVLGPEKLPKLAAQLGRFAGQARAMARHFRTQLEQEIAAEQLKRELKEADEAINKIAAQTPPGSPVTPQPDVYMRPDEPSVHADATSESSAVDHHEPVQHQAPAADGVDPYFNFGMDPAPHTISTPIGPVAADASSAAAAK